MCSRHYTRWRRHGDPFVVYPHGYRGTNEQRFWNKVVKGQPDECWIWTGPSTNGYGVHFVAATSDRPAHLVPAHAYAYELLVGPIPAGMEIDHVCRTHACVNPSPFHLEPVSHRVNVLRGESPAAKNARKTRCPAGHEYDRVVVRKSGAVTRRCSACISDQRAARYIKQKVIA